MGDFARRLAAMGGDVRPLEFSPNGQESYRLLEEILKGNPAGLVLVWVPNLDRALEVKNKIGSKTPVFGVEFGWLPQREWLLTDNQGMLNKASTRDLPARELTAYESRAVGIVKDFYKIQAQTASWEEEEFFGLPKDFLFVPLQLCRDKSVRRGQTAALSAVCEEYKKIPFDYRANIALLVLLARNTDLPIVARVHPLDRDKLNPVNFGEYLTRAGLTNRVRLIWKSSSMALIWAAKAVAGHSSTMLAEAMAIGKPVAGLGESFIAGSAGLFDARDPAKLRNWLMTPDPACDSTLWELIRRQIPSRRRRQTPMRMNPNVNAVLTAAKIKPEEATSEEKYSRCLDCPWSSLHSYAKWFPARVISEGVGRIVQALTGKEPLICNICGCVSAVKTRVEIAHCPFGAW